MKYINEPPLNSIRVFEVAARCLSFSRAARELGVHPPAVSRQVFDLEQALGVKLFKRTKPQLALTTPGQELYESVRRGLNEIRLGCDRARADQNEQTVKVVTSISIATCWLLKRLIGFYQLYPNINLELSTRDSTLNLDLDEYDIAIPYDAHRIPGLEAKKVFPESMIAVSHQKYLPAGRLFKPLELVSQPLLHYMEPMHRQDWQTLLANSGYVPPTPDRGMTFNSYVVYLEAAINGAGIAIGWEHLLEDHLENGSLCRASELALDTDRGYYCYLTERGVNKTAACQFRDWVCSIVKQ